MRVDEIAKDRSCTAIEKDPLHQYNFYYRAVVKG